MSNKFKSGAIGLARAVWEFIPGMFILLLVAHVFKIL
jgi:hypothetical protein